MAVGADTLVPASQQPTQTPDKVIEGVRGREDVVVLDKILGGLRFEATYVPVRQSYRDGVVDADERLVREVVVPDGKR